MFGESAFSELSFADFSGSVIVFIYFSPAKLRTKVVLVSPEDGKVLLTTAPINLRTKVEKFSEQILAPSIKITTNVNKG